MTRKVVAKKAEKIFDLMAEFAGYGFNKSHSCAYALLAYQTAYLKAHYPVEFMAAMLSSEAGNTEKVVKYINEARGMGIRVLPPDIFQRPVLHAGARRHPVWSRAQSRTSAKTPPKRSARLAPQERDSIAYLASASRSNRNSSTSASLRV